MALKSNESGGVLILISLCNLCVLCVSVVGICLSNITTETQRTQRLHREVRSGHYLIFGCAHYRFEDLHVASAATKISGETTANIAFSRLGISAEKIDSCQYHAGSTDPALSSAVIDERLLDRMQMVRAGNTLDRRYLGSIDLCNRNKATVHDLSVDDDGTRSTLAFATAFLGPGKLQLFTQHVKQARHRKHVELARLTIDLKLDCLNGDHLQDLPE
jgi:hypothetical protein